MRKLDIETWVRKKHYYYFKKMRYPRICVTVNVEISDLLHYIKKHDLPFSTTFLFLTSKAINEVEEMRMRIRGEEIVIHDVVHPSFTLLNEKETFHFCEVNFVQKYPLFSKNATDATLNALVEESLSDEPGRDDYIFVSALPWFTYTSISHPINDNESEFSVPRLSWGKYFESEGKILIPVTFEVNHALVDGIHIAKVLDHLNTYLKKPSKYLE